MAFALLLLQARRINNQKQRLEEEKFNSLKELAGEKPKLTLKTKYRRFMLNIKQKIKKFFNTITSFPENSCLHRSCVKLRHSGTLENYLLKSFIGFVGGFFLIYIFFIFFVVILKFTFGVATLLCSIFGCILTVGLAFNETVRQIVFLILPQFFSKRGRQALLAYAFILTLTGPCKNTMNNMGIMSESLACGQEQLKQAVKQIIELIKKPFMAIKEAIKKIVDLVKVIVKKLKEVFLTIKRIVMGIAKVIKAAFSFLGKIFNICSKKVGTPFQRCTKVFDQAITDCFASLGPIFNWLCNIAYVIKYVCYIVKPLDFICMLLDFINTSIIGVIVRKIKKFVRHIRSTFYVKIRFSHSFKFETTASKSLKEVSEGIIKDIKDRTKKLNDIFGLVSGLTSFFFFIIILKAILYRHKFLTNERFENRYITNNFREIDFRRAKMEKETILPLNSRERSKYVNITSFRLVKKERKSLFKNIAALTLASLKLGSHMFCDYSLWWVLDKIRFYGKYTTHVDTPKSVGLNVNGKGFVAELIRGVIKAFQPMGKTLKIDTVACLPDPIPPDTDKYFQIGFLLFLCWLFAIAEPYGLRIRMYVLNYYYPGRARERAVWLYNHILRNRTSFLKFARRLLKRKFFGQSDGKETKITCKELLRAKIEHPCLRFIFKPCLGDDKQTACVLCGEVFRENEEKKPIRCSTPGCPGLFCEPCYTDLQNTCTICKDPIQYGDLSDIDEEKDSSEDENSAKYKRRQSSKEQKKAENNLFTVLPYNEKNPSVLNVTTETEGSKVETEETKIDVENETETVLNIILPDEDETQTKDTSKTRSSAPTTRSSAGTDICISISSSESEYDYSSDVSTEYSYSYQYTKDYSDYQSSPRTSFVDVERQRIPDYVSMDTFQDYLFPPEEESTIVEEKQKRIIRHESSDEERALARNPLLRKRKKKSSQKPKKGYLKLFSSSDTDETEEEIQNEGSDVNEYVLQYRKSVIRKVKRWLNGKSEKGSKEDLIPLLELHHHDESNSSSQQESTITYIKPTHTPQQETSTQTETTLTESSEKETSLQPTTVTFSTNMNLRKNLLPNVRYEEVTKQKSTTSVASNLDTARTMNMNSKVNYLFGNINYEEINEERESSQEATLSTSRTSSSEMTLRRRRPPSSSSTSLATTSENTEESSKKYKDKVHSYYKSLPIPKEYSKTQTKKDTKGSYTSSFLKLL